MSAQGKTHKTPLGGLVDAPMVVEIISKPVCRVERARIKIMAPTVRFILYHRNESPKYLNQAN